MRLFFAAWLILGSWLLGSGARAQVAASDNEAQARAAFESGRELYDHGSFVQAADAFERAHQLSGRDALLYNIYLAHRDANQPEQAATALRSYLQRVENIENRPQLESRLRALEEGLARKREEPSETTERPNAASEQPPATPATPQASRARFIAGVSLASVGGAMVLSALATGLVTRARQNELERDCTNRVCKESLKGTRDSGERLARTTDALLFGGVAIAAAGTVLLVLDRIRRREAKASTQRAEPRVAAFCTSSGCSASASLRF